jgi:thioredoxin-like negative regulator of GroEL
MIVNGAKDKLPIEVEEVDIDDNIMMAQQFNVRSVPTLVIVDEQENELKRHVGLLNEETLLEFLKG